MVCSVVWWARSYPDLSARASSWLPSKYAVRELDMCIICEVDMCSISMR